MPPTESIGSPHDIQSSKYCLNQIAGGLPYRAPRSQGLQQEIAIQAQLDLTKTATELRALARIGLARQNQSKRWHTTTAGSMSSCDVPDRLRRNSGLPGPGALRLLQLLYRPMRGSEIAEQLAFSQKEFVSLLIRLHAQGRGELWRSGYALLDCDARRRQRTPLLSRGEEHVLSAIPREYATDATKIRLAARMPEHTVQDPSVWLPADLSKRLKD